MIMYHAKAMLVKLQISTSSTLTFASSYVTVHAHCCGQTCMLDKLRRGFADEAFPKLRRPYVCMLCHTFEFMIIMTNAPESIDSLFNV